MEAIKKKQIETVLMGDTLNPYIYDQADFKSFYTDCGEANTNKYPVFDVITSHNKKTARLIIRNISLFYELLQGIGLLGSL